MAPWCMAGPHGKRPRPAATVVERLSKRPPEFAFWETPQGSWQGLWQIQEDLGDTKEDVQHANIELLPYYDVILNYMILHN